MRDIRASVPRRVWSSGGAAALPWWRSPPHRPRRRSEWRSRRVPLRQRSMPRRSPPRPLALLPLNAARPAYFAAEPSCSSMRISWLYLASRSERDSEPVLICPQLQATARSAIVEVLGFARAVRHHRGVGRRGGRYRRRRAFPTSEPIWLTLTRIELATPILMPDFSRSVLVTNRSSPTSWTFLPSSVGQRLPAFPVVLGHAVFDGDDRELADEPLEELARSRRTTATCPRLPSRTCRP